MDTRRALQAKVSCVKPVLLLPFLPQPLQVDVGMPDQVSGEGLHRRVGVGVRVACCVQGRLKLFSAGVLALGFGKGFIGVAYVLGEVGVARLVGELCGQVHNVAVRRRALGGDSPASLLRAVIAASRLRPSFTSSRSGWPAQMGFVCVTIVGMIASRDCGGPFS